jgi:hypothetical protein
LLLFFAVFLALFLAVFFLGTFDPFFLASDNPIAIACFRLDTLRPLPLLSVPFFLFRMVFATVFPAPFEYFAIGLDFSWHA